MRNLSPLAGLLLILASAGCHGNYPWSHSFNPYGEAPPDSPRGQCERAAYHDPAVRTALVNEAGTPSESQYWNEQVRQAVLAATQRCMMQRGGTEGGGGVELPRSD